jgi:hypothetical protein
MKKCIACKTEHSNYSKRCEPCRLKTNEENRKRHLEWKSLGKCVKCGSEKGNLEGVHCESCANKHKQRAMKRRERFSCSGCVECGGSTGSSDLKTCKVCRSKRNSNNREFKLEAFAAYGGSCRCCGESEELFLTLDHVENNGAEERRKLGSKGRGPTFYRYLKRLNFPPGYQVLCANCNMGKYLNKGTCPHKH